MGLILIAEPVTHSSGAGPGRRNRRLRAKSSDSVTEDFHPKI
jgi:hypothetical protein